MTDLPGVVFLHIPKAAGVSVNNILMTLYPKDSQFWYTRHSWDSYEESPKIRYIHGHFDFETAKTFATDRRLITFVRDPVARMLSEFYYWKSHTEWFVERDNLDAARVVQDLSVRDFLESDIPMLRVRNSNFNTKLLAGFDAWQANQERVDDELFDRARRNLERFDYIGIVEEMASSVDGLLAWLGSERRYEGKVENALADLPDGKFYKDVEREVVNSSICRLLLERNSYDLRLYEQAVELSHAQRAALAR